MTMTSQDYWLADNLIERSRILACIILELNVDHMNRPIFIAQQTWKCDL
jgi:hypothetical protein